VPFVVQELKSNFYVGASLLLGSLPNSTLSPVILQIWGPIVAFWVSGAQNQILLFLWGVSQTQTLLPAFAYNGAQWGLLGFRCSKSNCGLELLPFDLVPNSNLTLGLLPIFGPKLKFFSVDFSHFGRPLGLFEVRDLKIRCFLVHFPFWGVSQTPVRCAIRVHQFFTQRDVPVLDHPPYFLDLVPANGQKALKSNFNLRHKDAKKPQGQITGW
jgi:hypothetical protein